MPIVSVLATMGAMLSLLSVLPFAGLAPFYAGALLVGLSIVWAVAIWSDTLGVSDPDPLAYVLSSELFSAVGFSFVFRIASTFSYQMAQGVLLALPLIAIACTIVSQERLDKAGSDAVIEGIAEHNRASLILVCVSAFFAVASSTIVYVSGREGIHLDSSLNYMVFAEVLAVVVLGAACSMLHWLASQPARPRYAPQFMVAVLCVPSFAVGVATGCVYDPENAANLMWEVSFWVMLVAVFAYDLRSTLYLGEGLAIGVMFESLCVGQIAAHLTLHVEGSLAVRVAACVLGAAYLAGVAAQLFQAHGHRPQVYSAPVQAAAKSPRSCAAELPPRQAETIMAPQTTMGEGLASDSAETLPEDPVDTLLHRCEELG